MAIVGPGALGSFFAQRSKTVPTAVIGRGAANVPEADWVIILVKAYDTVAAVRVARRHGLAAPTHSAFFQIIRIMEAR